MTSTTRSRPRTSAGRSSRAPTLSSSHDQVDRRSLRRARWVVVGRCRPSLTSAHVRSTPARARPFSAFLVLRGLATLHVRMERHAQTALALAGHIESRRTRASGLVPGPDSHPQRPWLSVSCSMAGAMVCLTWVTRRPRGIPRCAHHPAPDGVVGQRRTMAVHPPSTTHRQLDRPNLPPRGSRRAWFGSPSGSRTEDRSRRRL